MLNLNIHIVRIFAVLSCYPRHQLLLEKTSRAMKVKRSAALEAVVTSSSLGILTLDRFTGIL